MTKRILHVVGGMNRGGVETWLMHILRHIDRDEFQMDFLVHTTEPCAYDDEIRALGSRIIPCLSPANPLQYGQNFKRILREDGPYDVVHSHVHHFSGYVLWLAKQAGVPMRIAHSHNDTSSLKANASIKRRTYLWLMELWVSRYATNGLAASMQAAADLFGSAWESDPRYRVSYCGIDLEPFRQPINRAEVRAELGFPDDAFVVGHVGRFADQKNHRFFVEIAAEIVKREPRAYFLLIGDGPLRLEIEQQVNQLGLKNHFIFTGLRADVTRIMCGAMDIFLFPSLYEGLPLVLLEAQAARLPCIFTDTITAELDVHKDSLVRASLNAPASAWAETILSIHLIHEDDEPQEDALKKSVFDIACCVDDLLGVYSNMFHRLVLAK